LETFHKPNGNHERKEMAKNVTMSSEKSLVQYTADSPQIFANTLTELHHTHNAVITRISSLSKKAIPIMLVLAGLMGFVILISNAPPIIDKIAEVTGMQPPKVVYLTPDEATARGLDIRNIPTVDQATTDPKEFCDRNPSKCDGDMVLPEYSNLVDGGSATMVVDEIPTIRVPDNIVGEADNPNGMKIKYSHYLSGGVVAEDDIDDFVAVICDPPTNKIFPIGETTVTCTATDSGGNTATATFLVTIQGESESVAEQLIPVIPTPDLTP